MQNNRSDNVLKIHWVKTIHRRLEMRWKASPAAKAARSVAAPSVISFTDAREAA